MRIPADGAHPVTRRRVLQHTVVLLWAAAVAPLLGACRRLIGDAPNAAPVTSTATTPPPTREAAAAATSEPTQPTETATPPRAVVALVSASDRADGVRRAIALLGGLSFSGRRVLLKPNYNSADPAPGSTHPDVLRAIVTYLKAGGTDTITVGDRSGMGDTTEVMQQLGVLDFAREAGFETVAFDELPDEEWDVIRDPAHHWSQGFPVPRLLLDAEAVVQTCNLKTHRYGGHFSLSLKNSIGLVAKNHGGYNYMDELHESASQRLMIAEANSAYATDLIVVDGVEAFVKGGPESGTTVAPGVILAGTDRVAVDAVGVAILRLYGTTDEVGRGRIFEQEQIARAVELGLGVDSPDRIEIVSDDDAGEDYAARVMAVLLG